jgi:hypothetical protein
MIDGGRKGLLILGLMCFKAGKTERAGRLREEVEVVCKFNLHHEVFKFK